MRSFLFFLVFATVLFFVGFGAARFGIVEKLSMKVSRQNDSSQGRGFRPALYPEKKLPFCIAIIGRNNGAFLEKTIRSALSQSYEQFRVIYVDDGSDDGSFELAQEIIEHQEKVHKIRMIRNEIPIGVYRSLASVVQKCEDDEIVVALDGKDWLAHEWVLDFLNRYYADPDLWVTYSRSCEYPSYQISSSFDLKELPFHTFYAHLFQSLKETTEHFPSYLLDVAKDHSQNLSQVLSITPSDGI